MKKFSVPCVFGGQKQPFTIYIGAPEDAHHPLHFQAEWLSKERGGQIPSEIMESIQKLHELAEKNNVPFEELCVYALTAASEEQQYQEVETSQNNNDSSLATEVEASNTDDAVVTEKAIAETEDNIMADLEDAFANIENSDTTEEQIAHQEHTKQQPVEPQMQDDPFAAAPAHPAQEEQAPLEPTNIEEDNPFASTEPAAPTTAQPIEAAPEPVQESAPPVSAEPQPVEQQMQDDPFAAAAEQIVQEEQAPIESPADIEEDNPFSSTEPAAPTTAQPIEAAPEPVQETAPPVSAEPQPVEPQMQDDPFAAVPEHPAQQEQAPLEPTNIEEDNPFSSTEPAAPTTAQPIEAAPEPAQETAPPVSAEPQPVEPQMQDDPFAAAPEHPAQQEQASHSVPEEDLADRFMHEIETSKPSEGKSDFFPEPKENPSFMQEDTKTTTAEHDAKLFDGLQKAFEEMHGEEKPSNNADIFAGSEKNQVTKKDS